MLTPEEELKILKESPTYEVYIACRKQIISWTEEMKKNPVSISSGNEEDARAFDKTLKFIDGIPKIFDNLEFLRQKMTPQELKNSEQEATSLIDEVRKGITDAAKRQ